MEWTTGADFELTADPASLAAGRALASARNWTNLGKAGALAWGECRGSGSRPYQVVADRKASAYRCSCPSRRFPCKHVVALFLLAQEHDASFEDCEPPEWVRAWEAKREARVKNREENPEPASDEGSARSASGKEKRADARRTKVAAGLSDLSRWLGDVMRRGLADTLPTLEARARDQAKRLIDAQAPGPAKRLERLADSLVGFTEHKSERTFDQLLRLHLLIERHGRLESLPPTDRAEVNAAIGYNMKREDALSGERIRDAWRVLGKRTWMEDARLQAQRTWVQGANTHKIALILDFAFGSSALDPSLRAGSIVDAELAFYPGPAPARAIVAQLHEELGPIDRLQGFASVAEAWDELQLALAVHPTVEELPLVIDNVCLIERGGDWFLADAAGDELPLARDFSAGWRLLGASGGGRIAMFGEWNGSSLLPLAVHTGLGFCPLEAPECAPACPDSVDPRLSRESAPEWKELWSTIQSGLDRRPLKRDAGSGPGVGMETALWNRSAVVWFSARAGIEPVRSETAVPSPAPEDRLPACPGSAGRRLFRMLAGAHTEFIAEWLELAAGRGFRAPADCLAGLLDLAGKERRLRPLVLRVLDNRGAWLAALRPQWRALLPREPAELESIWSLGGRLERRDALAELRARDPDRARELVASAWATESAQDRAEFLEQFVANLGPGDEDFLERGLDDRSKAVRGIAAGLLARLTGSRLRARMRERLFSCIDVTSGRLHVVSVPECDEAMKRDGIDPDSAGQEAKSRESWVVSKLVAATPPEAWIELGLSPQAWASAARMNADWRTELWIGAATAVARTEGAADWVEPLVRRAPKELPSSAQALAGELAAKLEGPARDRLVIELIGSTRDPFRSPAAARLIGCVRGPIGVELGRMILYWLREFGELKRVRGTIGNDLALPAEWLSFIASRLPIALCGEFEDAVADLEAHPGRQFGSALDNLLDRVRFRRDMHKEFSE